MSTRNASPFDPWMREAEPTSTAVVHGLGQCFLDERDPCDECLEFQMACKRYYEFKDQDKPAASASSGAGETLSDEQLWHKYKSVLSEQGFPAMLHHGFLAAIREATAAQSQQIKELKRQLSNEKTGRDFARSDIQVLRKRAETAEQQLAASQERNRELKDALVVGLQWD